MLNYCLVAEKCWRKREGKRENKHLDLMFYFCFCFFCHENARAALRQASPEKFFLAREDSNWTLFFLAISSAVCQNVNLMELLENKTVPFVKTFALVVCFMEPNLQLKNKIKIRIGNWCKYAWFVLNHWNSRPLTFSFFSAVELARGQQHWLIP